MCPLGELCWIDDAHLQQMQALVGTHLHLKCHQHLLPHGSLRKQLLLQRRLVEASRAMILATRTLPRLL